MVQFHRRSTTAALTEWSPCVATRLTPCGVALGRPFRRYHSCFELPFQNTLIGPVLITYAWSIFADL